MTNPTTSAQYSLGDRSAGGTEPGAHHDRCASLLGQGCDCRSPFTQPRLRVVPVTLKEANAFVDEHHRHHEGNAKHRISTGVIDESDTVRGVAIMARPKARNLPQYAITEVVRLATDGCPNACSALYGACCRIADAAGYLKAITYTLLSEPGTSLRAAGWKPTAVTDGGSWDRPSRGRTDSHPLDRKIRWECRHSDTPAIDLTALREAS